jgi:hypothetical protein
MKRFHRYWGNLSSRLGLALRCGLCEEKESRGELHTRKASRMLPRLVNLLWYLLSHVRYIQHFNQNSAAHISHISIKRTRKGRLNSKIDG